MTKSRAVLTGPFLASLAATAFCLWTALGNDVNICVTTGCSLYHDFTVFGVSLWWYGAGAFSLLAVCALFGLAALGRGLAALFLSGDILLLFLMMLTAPCVSCLFIAVFFCAAYLLFRSASLSTARPQDKPARPVMAWIWLFLFAINGGAVARSQMEIWPILDESGEGRGRMFFSPSCAHCAEGVKALSGSVYMAFYPVADNDSDIFRIARMRELLDKGLNMAEAFEQSSDFPEPGYFSYLNPGLLLLRLRLLVNKAHVFSAGSQGVPFFEYLGLPPDLRKRAAEEARQESRALSSGQGAEDGPRSADLPIEIGGQCGGAVPCPPSD